MGAAPLAPRWGGPVAPSQGSLPLPRARACFYMAPHNRPHARAHAQVVRAQSTEGLSLVSNCVELLCYTIIVAYNLNHVRRARVLARACA